MSYIFFIVLLGIFLVVAFIAGWLFVLKKKYEKEEPEIDRELVGKYKSKLKEELLEELEQ